MRRSWAGLLSLVMLLLGDALVAQAIAPELAFSGSVAPQGVLKVILRNAPPNQPVVLVVGEQPGTSSISFGALGSLNLGIASPWSLFPVGSTDAAGTFGATFTFSATLVLPHPHDSVMHAQAITFGTLPPGGRPWCTPFSAGLAFCLSTVALVPIG